LYNNIQFINIAANHGQLPEITEEKKPLNTEPIIDCGLWPHYKIIASANSKYII
jgi:hypothetical protein